jgi:prophage regulatory protein|tara:strand:- start:469 stop:714 length:246 start_codon:yes stop_codon:yes gene_type:complete
MEDYEILNTEKFIRIKGVQGLSGLSRSQIYALVAKGQFPKQIKVSEKASAWLLSELQAWMTERVAGRSQAQGDWRESSKQN